MKKLLQKILMTFALGSIMFSLNAQVVSDSIEMGNGYANDVYYSFENGEVLSTPRAAWDIAFHTPIFSAAILTNGAAGVNLWTYPNADTAGWNSIDTNGLATWPIMYNNEQYWEDGAFNRNGPDHPDYGWGKYNPVNHNVVGDSLYILKCLDGQYRKLWITLKNSIANTYYLRYANLDGTDEHNVALDINPYKSKNFVYYSFPGEDLIDREPDTAAWDVLFTQYKAVHPSGSVVTVTGVLNNTKVYANRFHPVDMEYIDWLSQPLDSTRAPIGWDWKSLNFQTFEYEMVDSLLFFVQTWDDDIYKLYFTAFYGSMSGGKAVFNKELISASSITEILPAAGNMTVGPNPVVDRINILFEDEVNELVDYRLIDLSGRQILSGQYAVTDSRMELQIPKGYVTTGMHVLFVRVGNKAFTSKLIVNSK